MADKAVVTQTTLDAIGQAIIAKGGATAPMTPAQMPGAIASIPSGEWRKPDDWPDMEKVIDDYPAPDGFPYKAAFLIDDSFDDFLIYKNYTNFRCRISANPNTVITPTSTSVDMSACPPGLRWIVLYAKTLSHNDFADVDYIRFAATGSNYDRNNTFRWIVTGDGFFAYEILSFAINLEAFVSKGLGILANQSNYERNESLQVLRCKRIVASSSTACSALFSNTRKLKKVECDSGIIESNGCTNFGYMFSDSGIEYPPFFDCSLGTNFNSFLQNSSIARLPAGIQFTDMITTANQMFNSANQLTELPDDIDLSSCTGLTNTFRVERSVCENVPRRLKANVSFAIFNGTTWWPTRFDRTSLAEFDSNGNVIDGLAFNINSVSTAQTITLPTAMRNLYTDDEQGAIEDAFNAKGWTVAW